MLTNPLVALRGLESVIIEKKTQGWTITELLLKVTVANDFFLDNRWCLGQLMLTSTDSIIVLRGLELLIIGEQT